VVAVDAGEFPVFPQVIEHAIEFKVERPRFVGYLPAIRPEDPLPDKGVTVDTAKNMPIACQHECEGESFVTVT